MGSQLKMINSDTIFGEYVKQFADEALNSLNEYENRLKIFNLMNSETEDIENLYKMSLALQDTKTRLKDAIDPLLRAYDKLSEAKVLDPKVMSLDNVERFREMLKIRKAPEPKQKPKSFKAGLNSKLGSLKTLKDKFGHVRRPSMYSDTDKTTLNNTKSTSNQFSPISSLRTKLSKTKKRLSRKIFKLLAL